MKFRHTGEVKVAKIGIKGIRNKRTTISRKLREEAAAKIKRRREKLEQYDIYESEYSQYM